MPNDEYHGLVLLELGQRSAGNERVRRVALGEVLEETVGDLHGPGGAARAALVPVRVEHEMADHELTASLEHVEQAHRAVRTLELVVLLDLHHRELAPFYVQRIPLLGEILLLLQQVLACDEPLVA